MIERVRSFFRTPSFGGDVERSRRGAVVWPLLTFILLGNLAVIALASSLPGNTPGSVLLFQGPLLVCTLTVMTLARRGWLRLAGWSVASLVFGFVTMVVWFAGGLAANNGVAYIIVVMIAGATVSRRAAFLFIGLTFINVALVTWAEVDGWLPKPLSPPTSINALVALCITTLLAWAVHDLAVRAFARAAAERDDAQRRLSQAQKLELVGRLAAGLAHDVNNILTVMFHATTLLRGRVGNDGDAHQHLEHLDRATDSAAMLMSQLLSLSRDPSNKPTTFDMRQLIDQVKSLVRGLSGHGVTLTFTNSPEPLPVRADRSAILRIALNLLLNAREAMPADGGGRIELAIGRQGEEVWLRVSDTGMGMDPEVRAHLFEPFFTTKSNGTGLGLVVVATAVRECSGRIDVDSKPRAGSQFTVYFPLRAELAA